MYRSQNQILKQIFEKISMFNLAKEVTEPGIQYSKTNNPDQVLKHPQNKIILLTNNLFQLMFAKCLWRESIKHDQDMGG